MGRGPGLPAYRAAQILRGIYQRGAASVAALADLPRDLRTALERDFVLAASPVPLVARSTDGTRKLLFTLEAGRAIESVIIPDPLRLTLPYRRRPAAPSAVGLATARIRWQRHLSARDCRQVLAARHELVGDERLTNIVFVGMGEPLANYDELVDAIEILLAEWGLGFSSRRITVSTVGLVPQLQRLVRDTPVNIAVSLTATTDAQRDWLMPVNRKYPLATLLDACRTLPIAQRRRITFEYVMLAGVNDTPADATRLMRLLHGIRAKVNLIPFNPFPDAGFGRPRPMASRPFNNSCSPPGSMPPSASAAAATFRPPADSSRPPAARRCSERVSGIGVVVNPRAGGNRRAAIAPHASATWSATSAGCARPLPSITSPKSSRSAGGAPSM